MPRPRRLDFESHATLDAALVASIGLLACGGGGGAVAGGGPLVNWVGTDPYWFGDPADIPRLNDWSKGFHALAKLANPQVET